MIRPPAVAGRFYPADASALRHLVDGLLAEARPEPVGARPAGVVVPHAGYVYSGPVAATAYRLLGDAGTPIERAVLLGPAHFVPVDGLAVSGAEAWDGPLGGVPVDDEARARLLAHPHAGVDDAAHTPEHSLEVQVPFLQRVLGEGVAILPVLVGAAPADLVADAIATVWPAPGSVLVVSTDLSHYLDRATAARTDTVTAAAVTAGHLDVLGPHRACGAAALCGALAAAHRSGLVAHLLDLRTSADTAGPPDRVVGYGAFALA